MLCLLLFVLLLFRAFVHSATTAKRLSSHSATSMACVVRRSRPKKKQKTTHFIGNHMPRLNLPQSHWIAADWLHCWAAIKRYTLLVYCCHFTCCQIIAIVVVIVNYTIHRRHLSALVPQSIHTHKNVHIDNRRTRRPSTPFLSTLTTALSNSLRFNHATCCCCNIHWIHSIPCAALHWPSITSLLFRTQHWYALHISLAICLASICF